jgi:hypothetical protein
MLQQNALRVPWLCRTGPKRLVLSYFGPLEESPPLLGQLTKRVQTRFHTISKRANLLQSGISNGSS